MIILLNIRIYCDNAEPDYLLCFLNSQSSLTGESGTIEKVADTQENRTTPLLDLKNICLMVTFRANFLLIHSILLMSLTTRNICIAGNKCSVRVWHWIGDIHRF